MVGPTLTDIREHVERLATEDGRYYVVCGRTGARPVPAVGSRFPDRATARAAAGATEQYRSTLRRYDPQVPYYDLIVCETPGEEATAPHRLAPTHERGRPRPSGPDCAGDTTPGRRARIEFCHRVAGAVFETLSASGNDDVEAAVMDAYFELAETAEDPDELCLCLLESMATELDERLAPADQLEALVDAAARLEAPVAGERPLDATLAALDRQGLVGSYTRTPWSVDLDEGGASVVVGISGYALSARDGRLPVLPVTLERCRQHAKRVPLCTAATAVENGWRLTFARAGTDQRDGLVAAPVDGGD
jgi:hypothetical protein